MAKLIFSDYGIDIKKNLLGYTISFESGGHQNNVLTRRISREDAEIAMSSEDGAIRIIERLS